MMNQQRRRDFTEINITPLTDIFLVLLIIMMVIAPMLDSQGLKMAVPSIGTDTNVTDDPKAMTLHVAPNGQFLLEDKVLPESELIQKLSASKKDFPDGLVIETEPDTLHGSMVKAMDSARAAGIEKIAVTSSQSAQSAQ